jgi:hypothetical protein
VDWQLALTALLIGGAAAYVLRAVLRPILGRGRAGCGSACGKCNTPEPPARPGRLGLPQLPDEGRR